MPARKKTVSVNRARTQLLHLNSLSRRHITVQEMWNKYFKAVKGRVSELKAEEAKLGDSPNSVKEVQAEREQLETILGLARKALRKPIKDLDKKL